MFGTVYCICCERDIQIGPKSNEDETKFLERHQHKDPECKSIGDAKRARLNIDDYAAVGGAGRDEFEVNDDYDHFDYGQEMTVAEFTGNDIRNDKAGRKDCVLGTVQLEETNEGEMRKYRPYHLEASEDILKIRLFMDGEITKKFEKMRTPRGKDHPKKYTDLIELYTLGVDFNLSRSEKDEMLATFTRILENNGVGDYATIPKTFESIDEMFKSSYAELFEKNVYEYPLDKDLFGRFEFPLKDEKPLAPMRGLALDVKTVLAEALLEIEPSQFITEYKRDDDILKGCETSDDFRKISEDDQLFDHHPQYGHPISLCLTVRTDETTCNTARTESEQAVVLSILNAKGAAYKMIFLGYAPIHLPYPKAYIEKLLVAGTMNVCCGSCTCFCRTF